MSPSLGVGFSAAADGREVKVDQDCVLAGSHSSKAVVISLDPKATVANTVTAPANINDDNVIAVYNGINVGLDFPLSASQSVFVSCNGAGMVVLRFTLPAVV